MIAIPIVTVGNYLGVVLGPVIFSMMGPRGPIDWPSIAIHKVILRGSFLSALLISAARFLAKHKREKDAAQRTARIHDAMDHMTAAGIAAGLKTPRAPHRKWDTGTGTSEPHKTKGRDGHGPYGTPMP